MLCKASRSNSTLSKEVLLQNTKGCNLVYSMFHTHDQGALTLSHVILPDEGGCNEYLATLVVDQGEYITIYYTT